MHTKISTSAMRTPGYETALILSVRRKEENSLIIVMSPRMDNWTYATRVSKQVSRAMCYQHLDIDPRLLLVERPKPWSVALQYQYETLPCKRDKGYLSANVV